MKSSIAESVTITPVLVADLHVEGERMPVYVHLIDHPDARVLVDTGMTVLHPCWPAWIPPLAPERAGPRPRRHRHRRHTGSEATLHQMRYSRPEADSESRSA